MVKIAALVCLLVPLLVSADAICDQGNLNYPANECSVSMDAYCNDSPAGGPIGPGNTRSFCRRSDTAQDRFCRVGGKNQVQPGNGGAGAANPPPDSDTCRRDYGSIKQACSSGDNRRGGRYSEDALNFLYLVQTNSGDCGNPADGPWV